MRYLATIKRFYDTHSMLFDSQEKAENWLNENNNNLEARTTIDLFDDDWTKLDSVVYTEGKNEDLI